MRSRIILAVLLVTAPAAAQTAPPPDAPSDDQVPDATPSEPAPLVPAAPEPAPEPAPAPAVAPVPTEAPAPATSPDPRTTVRRERTRPWAVVAGLEVGFGIPSGTTATVYESGRGTGLMVGLSYRRFALEWHLLQSYALQPKASQLRGETTVGSLDVSSVLLRARVLDLPVIELMAGPALLSSPIYVIGEDGEGNQRVEASQMRGVGALAGASIGFRVGSRVTVSFELRQVLAATWELPGRAYVVPGDPAPDGGVMYTTSAEDASGKARTATVLVRMTLY